MTAGDIDATFDELDRCFAAAIDAIEVDGDIEEFDAAMRRLMDAMNEVGRLIANSTFAPGVPLYMH